jgi:hypothetical protein
MIRSLSLIAILLFASAAPALAAPADADARGIVRPCRKPTVCKILPIRPIDSRS